MAIQRAKFTNWMGIALLELEFPEAGGIIEGGNAKGKTSVLKGLRAALAAHEIGPDAIRKGADSSEILVDVDHLSVRRVITKAGSDLKVIDGNTGRPISKAQTFLTSVLGVAPLDPIDLFLEKDEKKRRAKILSAMPCVVTTEMLARWVPEGTDLGLYLGRDAAGQPAIGGHGLEVIARLRKAFYDRRTEANRVTKDRGTIADQAVAKAVAEEAAVAAVKAALGAEPPSQTDAEQALRTAEAREAALIERERLAGQANEKSAATRAKAKGLRDQATQLLEKAIAPSPEIMEEARGAVRDLEGKAKENDAEIERLTRLLEAARQKGTEIAGHLGYAKNALADLERKHDEVEAAIQRAADLNGQADDLVAALGDSATPPSEAEVNAAQDAVQRAREVLAGVQRLAVAAKLRQAADEAKVAHDEAKRTSTALDETIAKLTNDAPAALLAASDGISGLGIDGDDITLDGVSLGRLSSMEQLRFAVQVAKRLNARSKLLCVDGLERLDREHLAEFRRLATADGFQVIATRVTETGGEAVLRPIEEGSES